MRKEDNDWEIKPYFNVDEEGKWAKINNIEYSISDDTASLLHAILLLVDAVNDKRM